MVLLRGSSLQIHLVSSAVMGDGLRHSVSINRYALLTLRPACENTIEVPCDFVISRVVASPSCGRRVTSTVSVSRRTCMPSIREHRRHICAEDCGCRDSRCPAAYVSVWLHVYAWSATNPVLIAEGRSQQVSSFHKSVTLCVQHGRRDRRKRAAWTFEPK